MFSTVEPTLPTAIQTYWRRKAAASFWISGANVALLLSARVSRQSPRVLPGHAGVLT